MSQQGIEPVASSAPDHTTTGPTPATPPAPVPVPPTASASPAAPTQPDGRELRSQRTRASIIEAWLDLVEAGNVSPTARETADQAGTGLRTIFQHFGDMEDLHTSAAALHFERIAPFVAFSPEGNFDERVAQFVHHRRRLFERVTPVRRAAMHRFMLAPHIGPLMRVADERFASIIGVAFQPELASIEDPAEQRLVRMAAGSALSWPTWDHLRTSVGLSGTDSTAVFARSAASLLGPYAS